jgi:hypothetical protein
LQEKKLEGEEEEKYPQENVEVKMCRESTGLG